MPNSIFFTKTGHAIHGSFDVKRIGTPASHGCVRLSPENAAVLFNLVKADGVLNTQVVLTGVEPPPSANIARAPAQNPNAAAQNPYPNPNAAPNDSIDNQAYGIPRYQQRAPIDNQTYGSADDHRYPAPTYRYQQRAPTDDQRYAQDGTPHSRLQQQQPAYRHSSSLITAAAIISSSSRSPITARAIPIRIMAIRPRRIITGAATGD